MVKKDNKIIWIVGIILVIFLLNNNAKKTAETCVSNEPTSLEGYDLVELDSLGDFKDVGCVLYQDRITCGVSLEGEGTELLILTDTLADFEEGCDTVVTQAVSNGELIYVRNYNGVDIYTEETETDSGVTHFCNDNDDVIITVLTSEGKNPDSLTNKYIDTFYACTPGEACPDVWDPVCGVDGNTYSNNCYAGIKGVTIDYNGECKGTWIPGISNGMIILIGIFVVILMLFMRR